MYRLSVTQGKRGTGQFHVLQMREPLTTENHCGNWHSCKSIQHCQFFRNLCHECCCIANILWNVACSFNRTNTSEYVDGCICFHRDPMEALAAIKGMCDKLPWVCRPKGKSYTRAGFIGALRFNTSSTSWKTLLQNIRCWEQVHHTCIRVHPTTQPLQHQLEVSGYIRANNSSV